MSRSFIKYISNELNLARAGLEMGTFLFRADNLSSFFFSMAMNMLHYLLLVCKKYYSIFLLFFSSFFQDRREYSKTFKGRYFNFLGYFFSVYCVWKIFMVGWLSSSTVSFHVTSFLFFHCRVVSGIGWLSFFSDM